MKPIDLLTEKEYDKIIRFVDPDNRPECSAEYRI